MESEKTKSWIYKCLKGDKPNIPLENLEEEDLEDWTYEFLLDLRSIFENFIQAFEELKTKDGPPDMAEKLKSSLFIYDLADKKGFMLFRKEGYRLTFSYVRPGCIRVHFFKQNPFSEPESFVDSHIRALTNDTLSINWVHEGRKGFVDIQVLARYYMKRFLQEI